jgi:hypothetical protein
MPYHCPNCGTSNGFLNCLSAVNGRKQSWTCKNCNHVLVKDISPTKALHAFLVATVSMPLLFILMGFKYEKVQELVESAIGVEQGSGFALIVALVFAVYLAVTTGVTYAFYCKANIEQK